MADAPAAGPRVLVAEDSAAIRAVVAYLLRARGYEVVEAPDGQAAVDAALAAPPDLVVLDVLMPRLNGFEVCARLKAAPETKDVPILLLTSVAKDSGKSDDHWRRMSGADEFVSKPFQARDLLDRIARLISARGFAREEKTPSGRILPGA